MLTYLLVLPEIQNDQLVVAGSGHVYNSTLDKMSIMHK